MSSSGSKTKKKKPGTDEKSRKEEKKWMTKVRQLTHMAQGDPNYPNLEAWGKETQFNERTRIAIEGMENLNDPRILPLLLMKWKNKAEPASQVLQSVLPQSDNAALNQDCENEMQESNLDSNQLYGKGVWIKEMEANASQMAKETQSMKEYLNQMIEMQEEKDQQRQNLKVRVIIGGILQSVLKSWTAMLEKSFVNNNDEVQGYQGVGSLPFELENGQLTINFPPTSVHNHELTISEEKQAKEATLTIGLGAGGVTQLKLDNSEMIDHRLIWKIDDDFDIPIEDFLDDTCTIHNYKVSKFNAGALRKIFENYPNVAENFGITDPEFRSYFMDSLAGLYQKIEDKKEELEQKASKIEEIELNDLQSIIGDEELNVFQSKIKDMEHIGLQVSWLQTMLKDVSDMKKSIEGIITDRDEDRKAQQRMAEERQQRMAEERQQRVEKIFKKQRM